MNELNYDIINQYLDGIMNATERAAFEKLMQQDEGLKNEVTLLKDINETLKIKLQPGENEKALRNTMNELHEEHFGVKEKAKIIPFRRSRWMVAAAAVFIITMILSVWQPWQKSLFQQYAAVEMPAVSERGAGEDIRLRQATEFFNNNNFTSAIPLFKLILKDDPQNTFVQYYYAIALLQNGEVENSRKELTLLYNGASLFKNDAAFYIALSYLREKNKAACATWLNKIVTDAGIYSRAQELLKKL